MKPSVLLLLAVLAAAAVIAGCTSAPAALPTGTPVPATTSISTPELTPVPQPSFSLGPAYLNDPHGYTFLSENDVVTKQFIVDDPSWGIEFKVHTLNYNLNYCWFTMDVTDINTDQTAHYGYGREFAYDL